MLHVVNYSYVQERPGNSWTYHQELVKLSYIQYLQKQCLFQYFSDYSVVFLTLVSIQLYLHRHVPSDDLCLKAFHSKRGQLHLQTILLLPSRSLVQLKMLRDVQERNEASSVAQNKEALQTAHIKLPFFSGNTASTKLAFFIITDLADLTGVVKLAWAGVSTVLTRSKRFSQNTACLFLDLLP